MVEVERMYEYEGRGDVSGLKVCKVVCRLRESVWM